MVAQELVDYTHSLLGQLGAIAAEKGLTANEWLGLSLDIAGIIFILGEESDSYANLQSFRFESAEALMAHSAAIGTVARLRALGVHEGNAREYIETRLRDAGR